MSEIYCAHSTALPHYRGGYVVCGLCGNEWYANDPAPLAVIGVTSAAEVNRYPFLVKMRDRQEKGGGGIIE